MSKLFSCLRHFIIVVFTLFVSSISIAQNITDTLYKEAETHQLIAQIEEDPMLKLEWLTALHFHKIINDYRAEKKAKSIHWDHKLWMASRNHNVYLMRDLKHLSHNQSKNNPFFSGRYPEDRVEYVSYNSREFTQAGFENCNFSGRSLALDRINLDLVKSLSTEEMIKLAKSTAEDGFESWKNSMGHNQNMLNTDHIAHGTSFVFAQDGVYGTSVFAGLQQSYRPDNLFIPFVLSVVNESLFNIQDNYQEFNAPKNEMNKIKFKHFYNMTLFFMDKEIKKSKALFEVSKMSPLPKNEKEIKKAYRRARGFRGFFELLFNQIDVKTYAFELTHEAFQKLQGILTLNEKLKDFAQDAPTDIKFWGGDILFTTLDDKVELEVRVFYLH